jgi:hypothetical protein
MPPHAAAADADADADASLFAGVRFALHGFDAVSESQVRTVRRAAPPPSAPRASIPGSPLTRFPSLARSIA